MNIYKIKIKNIINYFIMMFELILSAYYFIMINRESFITG